MTRIVSIPSSVMRTLSVDWDIDWGDQFTSATNESSRQVFFSRFPKWVGSPSVSFHHANIGIWQAIKSQAQGRSALYRIRLINPAAYDITEGSGGSFKKSGVPFSGGAKFETGKGFELDPLARVSGTVSKGAEQMRIDTTHAGVAPRLGQIMSHGAGHNNYPFMVTGVSHVSGNLYDIGVQMPLRAALADGDAIRMRGVGLFEAAESFTNNTSYDPTRSAQMTLRFTEFINR